MSTNQILLKQLLEEVRSIKATVLTKDDAKAFLTKNDAKAFVTKDDLKKELSSVATKQDLKVLHNDTIEDMSEVVNGLFVSADKLKADKSSVRKLETRVAKIEDIVLN